MLSYVAMGLRAIKSAIPKRIKKAIKSGFGFARNFDHASQLEIGQFGKFSVAYRVGTADEAVLSDSFDSDIFFRGLPEYRPEENHIIVDVGAHIGTFSMLAASHVPRGRVYAIEACKNTFNYLWVNVAINKLCNLDTSHLALSGHQGVTTLYYDEGNWGHSIVKKFSSKGESVATDTLDNFVRQKRITRCHLIKFNCEGAEFPILLASSPETLARFELMLILYHCDLATGHTYKELVNLLETNGFKTDVRNQAEQRGWIVARRLR
jgi:FkbM family methyltransferase